MNYSDPHTERVLEFNKIKKILARKAASVLGEEACLNIKPIADRREILLEMRRIEELKEILLASNYIPLHNIKDIKPLFKKVESGGILDPVEVKSVLSIIHTSSAMKSLVKEKLYPDLWKITKEIKLLPDLDNLISSSITPDEKIADDASPQLSKIKKDERILKDRIQKELTSILKKEKDSVAEDFITTRDGRWVIPVFAAQSRIKGIVHGISQSGATLFIEPLATVDMNNRLKTLECEEEEEIHKILRTITDKIRESLDAIKSNFAKLRYLDLIYAKARFSIDFKCIPPELNRNGYTKLIGGRHPLLGEDTVPLDIYFGNSYTTVLISGPNAGGKTVALKTIGLLTLMSYCGLEIPAKEGTEIGMFTKFYADIGDSQSIEENLSTFTAHLKEIKRILDNSDENTLVLLDEIGSGTDPVSGESLAMAILEELTARKVRVVATSHYTNLKLWVHSKKGMTNGAMEFDLNTLKPTFRLKLGQPGSSYALAIARRVGLSEKILSNTENILEKDKVKLDELLRELEEKNLDLKRELDALKEKGSTLNSSIAEYERKLAGVKKEIKMLRSEAKKEAQKIVDEGRRTVEEVVKKIRESTAEKSTIKFAKERLAHIEKSLQEEETQHPIEVKRGDRVYVKKLKSEGTVEIVVGNSVWVNMGKFKISVPNTGIEKL